MTTSCDTIATAWQTYIWDTATLAAITSRFFAYDPTLQSEVELTSLLHNREINYFAYLITKTERWIGLNVLQEDFTVAVQYVRQKDVSGANWTATRDAIETLLAQVRSELGETWQSTVSFYAPQEESYVIEEITIKEVPAWRARFVFTAKI